MSVKPFVRRFTSDLRFLGFLALLALSSTGAGEGGCARAEDSSDVAQDEIVAQYWLYHNANTDQTHVRATYRFGNDLGTILELSPPAGVTFGRTALGFDRNWGWHETVVAGVADGGTFVYTDTEATVSRVDVAPLPRIDMPAEIGPLKRDGAFTLTWVGAPLVAGEDVEVVVANAKNRLTFVRFDQATVGATNIVLGRDRLQQLPPGQAVLSIRRHRAVRQKSASVPNTVTTTFEARERLVAVE